MVVLLEGPQERVEPVYEGEASPFTEVLLDGLGFGRVSHVHFALHLVYFKKIVRKELWSIIH